jgi:hypothetical protein
MIFSAIATLLSGLLMWAALYKSLETQERRPALSLAYAIVGFGSFVPFGLALTMLCAHAVAELGCW